MKNLGAIVPVIEQLRGRRSRRPSVEQGPINMKSPIKSLATDTLTWQENNLPQIPGTFFLKSLKKNLRENAKKIFFKFQPRKYLYLIKKRWTREKLHSEVELQPLAMDKFQGNFEFFYVKNSSSRVKNSVTPYLD